MKNRIQTITLGLVLASTGHAAVQIATESSLGTRFADTAWGPTLSSTDLINAGQSTLESTVFTAAVWAGSGTNDGIVNNHDFEGDGPNTFVFSEGDPGDFTEAGKTWWATYNLDLTTNTFGYNITSIESFLGWKSASALHGNQTYSVWVSEVGSSSYTQLTSVAYSPFSSSSDAHHESHVTITEDATGVLASGVDSIRFIFEYPGDGGNSAGTVIRELDVYGVAAVPEPSAAALLMGLGVLGLMARRRR